MSLRPASTTWQDSILKQNETNKKVVSQKLPFVTKADTHGDGQLSFWGNLTTSLYQKQLLSSYSSQKTFKTKQDSNISPTRNKNLKKGNLT